MVSKDQKLASPSSFGRKRYIRSHAEPKSFNVSFEIGDPEKPDLPSNILSGVSIDELSSGFPVTVKIDGTGVKSGDNIKLVSSFNEDPFQTVEEITLTDSDIISGEVTFLADSFRLTGSSSLSEAQLQALEGSYVFKASINDQSNL